MPLFQLPEGKMILMTRWCSRESVKWWLLSVDVISVSKSIMHRDKQSNSPAWQRGYKCSRFASIQFHKILELLTRFFLWACQGDQLHDFHSHSLTRATLRRRQNRHCSFHMCSALWHYTLISKQHNNDGSKYAWLQLAHSAWKWYVAASKMCMLYLTD